MATPILVGTASWADRPLVASGRFYPRGVTTPEARLRYYASRFPLVEVDMTYYALPQRPVAEQWAARTPEGFTFDVKAFGLFTEHPVAINRLPKELKEQLPARLQSKRNLYLKDAPADAIDYCWSTFVDGILPLYESGKLGVTVFQFPKWVFPNRATWRYFEEVKRRLGPYRAAVEFRNDVWMRADNREETLARLGDLGFAYICVDEPQGFRSSVPPIVAATTDLAFVRFHGRNRETWEQRTGSSADRFDYWYRPEELEEWVPAFRELASQADEVHAVMNTNQANQGPANAEALEAALRGAGLQVQQPLLP